jgi:predicted ATPase
MLENLELYNFKSARDLKLKLAPLTALTGLNGSGKSSTLHALALLKQSIHERSDLSNLLLRGELIKLGRSEDVRFENAKDDEIRFVLKNNEATVEIVAGTPEGSDALPIVRCSGDLAHIARDLSISFQYIQADRITPAVQYAVAGAEDRDAGWLGCRGEFVVDFLVRNEKARVSTKRLFSKNYSSITKALLTQVAPTDGLLDQTSAWLQLFSPGARLRVSSVELSDVTSLRFSYTGTLVDSGSRNHRPENVGFGLTYCLPIIVACLATPPGGLLLLENPEAHLHPRGQAALGGLLAKCAADGVQIILETHSDHLINGIRIAVKDGEISNDDVAVHFFSRDVESGASTVTSPKLYANGRFSDWPEGFFDEWSRALDELLDV